MDEVDNDENETATPPLTAAERSLLLGFLDELSDYQSNAGCNDIELSNTPENVAMVREVLTQPDYADDEYFGTWEPGKGAKFYAPCGDHGLLGHLVRKLRGDGGTPTGATPSEPARLHSADYGAGYSAYMNGEMPGPAVIAADWNAGYNDAKKHHEGEPGGES